MSYAPNPNQQPTPPYFQQGQQNPPYPTAGGPPPPQHQGPYPPQGGYAPAPTSPYGAAPPSPHGAPGGFGQQVPPAVSQSFAYGQPTPGPPGAYGSGPPSPYGAPAGSEVYPSQGMPPPTQSMPPQAFENRAQSPYGAPPGGAPGGYPPTSPTGYPPAQGSGYPPAGSPSMYGPPQGQPGHGVPHSPQPGHPGPYAAAGVTAGAAVAAVAAKKQRPTIKAHTPFDPKADALALRKAMKGLGTDEKALIHVLCNRTNAQRQQIKATYATNVVGRNLEKDLRSETSGGFWETLKAMMMTPAGYDAKTLYKAIDGAGTAEEDIIEILATRSPVELEKIKAEYLRVHKKNLDSEIKKDTSGHFEKACVALLDTNQRKHTFAKPADQQTALAEATRLFKAGEGKTGTDEQTFINVLCFASPLQITLIAQEYLKLCPKYTLEASIDREFSGDIRKLLKSIVRFGVNGPYFFASVLHKSMDGIGTTEPTLIRVMVTRAEVDMEDIKLSYKQAYKTDLAKDIKGEIGGDFEKIMLALCK